MKAQRLPALILANAVMLTVALVITVLIGEWFVRIAAPQNLYRFPAGMFSEKPGLQYGLTENFDGEIETVEYQTQMRTNSMGLRESRDYGTKNPNSFRILAIGDSFTMGVGVESNESFPKRIEQLLDRRYANRNVEVINSGVPGYDTATEIDFVERYGLAMDPDLILVAFYVGNDLLDNIDGLNTKVVDGFLRGEKTSEGFLPAPIRSYLQRNSHLYQLVWPLQRKLLDKQFSERQAQKARQAFSIYAENSDSAMWAATYAQIDRLAALRDRVAIPIAMVIIPEPIQSTPERWQAIADSISRSDNEAFRRDYPGRKIKEYAQKKNIQTLDLLPNFDNGPADTPLYFAVDGHWTVTGNNVAAQAISDFLSGEQLISDPGLQAARQPTAKDY